MQIDLSNRYIDNNFWRITTAEARALAKESPLGRLPRLGYECTVSANGQAYWLTRTVVNRKLVWALHLKGDYAISSYVRGCR